MFGGVVRQVLDDLEARNRVMAAKNPPAPRRASPAVSPPWIRKASGSSDAHKFVPPPRYNHLKKISDGHATPDADSFLGAPGTHAYFRGSQPPPAPPLPPRDYLPIAGHRMRVKPRNPPIYDISDIDLSLSPNSSFEHSPGRRNESAASGGSGGSGGGEYKLWQHLPCLGEERGKFLLRVIRLHRQRGRDHPLRILVVGRTGEGKSTLINTLLGRDVSAVRPDCIDAVRHPAEPVEATFNSIRVLVWDTQGAQDGADMEAATFARVLASVERHRRPGEDLGVDVVLVCMSLISTRLSCDTRDTLRVITATLGAAVWRRAILTLTMANVLASVPPEDRQVQLPYHEYVRAFADAVLDGVRAIGVADDVVAAIKVVAVGRFDPGRPQSRCLPGCGDWPSNFWCACADRVESPAGRCALAIANEERLYFDPIQSSGGGTGEGGDGNGGNGGGLGPAINVHETGEGNRFLLALVNDVFPLLRVLALGPEYPGQQEALEDGRRRAASLLAALRDLLGSLEGAELSKGVVPVY